MIDPILELTNSLNWNVAYKQKLQAQGTGVEGEFYPIRRQNFLCPSNLLLIGCSSTKAKDKWYLGCRVSVNLSLGEIDSGSDFTGVTEIYRANAPLRRLKLMHWRAYTPKPYLVILDIPWWLEQVSIEAYWYDGTESDNHLQLLETMDDKLDNIITTLET